ncbi:unnamed protein product [Sympodiomycopsis kandeliae]
MSFQSAKDVTADSNGRVTRTSSNGSGSGSPVTTRSTASTSNSIFSPQDFSRNNNPTSSSATGASARSTSKSGKSNSSSSSSNHHPNATPTLSVTEHSNPNQHPEEAKWTRLPTSNQPALEERTDIAAPLPSPAPIRSHKTAKAARASIDTFGKPDTGISLNISDDEGEGHASHTQGHHRKPTSTSLSTLPLHSPPARLSLLPPLPTASLQMPLASPTPSRSSSSSAAGKDFKSEAQEYWAQKLSLRDNELASGESTTPSAVQMALSQANYSNRGLSNSSSTPTGGVQTPSSTFNDFDPGSAAAASSAVFASPSFFSSPDINASPNGFLFRQQQSQSQSHSQSSKWFNDSAVVRDSSESGRFDGSRSSREESYNSSNASIGKCSDSRPLLQDRNNGKSRNLKHAVPATFPIQPLPATLNELSPEERQALRKRNTKLVKLLGDEVLELQREQSNDVKGKQRNNGHSSPATAAVAGKKRFAHHTSKPSGSGLVSQDMASLWALERSQSHRPNSMSSPAGLTLVSSDRRRSYDEVTRGQVGPSQQATGSSNSHNRHSVADGFFDDAGPPSPFEVDPYHMRVRRYETRPQTQQHRTGNDIRRDSSRGPPLSPLPDDLNQKAAARLGITIQERKEDVDRSQRHRRKESFTPLPSNVNSKAAAMLGIAATEKRGDERAVMDDITSPAISKGSQSHSSSSDSRPRPHPRPGPRQRSRSRSRSHQGKVDPLRAEFSLAPSKAKKVSTTTPAKASTSQESTIRGESASRRVKKDEHHRSQSNQSHTRAPNANPPCPPRSSLDDLLGRVAGEVPNALRPGLATTKLGSYSGGAASSSTASHGNDQDLESHMDFGDDSDDQYDTSSSEEEEMMYTADGHDSVAAVDTAEAEEEEELNDADFIQDESTDSDSDYLSSSMFFPSSTTTDSETNTTATKLAAADRRETRRRRADKMSRWFGTVFPAHIIAPDSINDQPAYLSNDIPGTKKGINRSRPSSNSSADSNPTSGIGRQASPLVFDASRAASVAHTDKKGPQLGHHTANGVNHSVKHVV